MDQGANSVTVLAPTGRLDGITVFDFEPQINDAIETGSRRLILDFSQLTYLSSAGLRLVLRVVQKLRNCGGAVVIVAPGSRVFEILSVAGFPSFVPVTRTLEEAKTLCSEQVVKPRAARAAPELGLNLPECFCLLAFDAKEGGLKALPSSSVLGVPAACAVIELALEERLDWDLNAVRVTSRTPTKHPVLDSVLELVAKDSPQSIENCLRQISHHSPELERGILAGLVTKGILTYRKTRVAGIFRKQTLVLGDPRPLTVLREDLRAVLIGNQVPDIREAVLVGLLDTCGLFAGILSPEEVEKSRARITQLSQLDLIGQKLPKLIRQISRYAMPEMPI